MLSMVIPLPQPHPTQQLEAVSTNRFYTLHLQQQRLECNTHHREPAEVNAAGRILLVVGVLLLLLLVAATIAATATSTTASAVMSVTSPKISASLRIHCQMIFYLEK
jgi:hypothetical protein